MVTEETLVDGLDHAECVISSPDGFLYAGSEAGDIYRIDPESRSFEVIANTGGFVLGLAADGSGNLYVCDSELSAVMRISSSGEISTYSSGTSDRPMNIPNYPAFDATGNLYVSDSGGWGDGNGCVYRVAPGGCTTVWSIAAPAFPNGLALSPEDSHLYVAESIPPAIRKIRIDEEGLAGPSELVVELPGTVPDGLAFDRDSGLLIACYRPDTIYRLSTAGVLEVFAEDPLGTRLAAPTNVAFSASGSNDLYAANFARWHITRIRTRTAGLPLNYPRLD